MSNEEVIELLNNIAKKMADKAKRIGTNNLDVVNGILGAMNIVFDEITALGGEIKEIK